MVITLQGTTRVAVAMADVERRAYGLKACVWAVGWAEPKVRE